MVAYQATDRSVGFESWMIFLVGGKKSSLREYLASANATKLSIVANLAV
jgi:hypothetical protein